MANIIHNTVLIKIPKQPTTNIEVASKEARIVKVGMKGSQGASGNSAYEIAVKNGFVGTEEEWLSSLKGDSFKFEDLTQEQLNMLNISGLKYVIIGN